MNPWRHILPGEGRFSFFDGTEKSHYYYCLAPGRCLSVKGAVVVGDKRRESGSRLEDSYTSGMWTTKVWETAEHASRGKRILLFNNCSTHLGRCVVTERNHQWRTDQNDTSVTSSRLHTRRCFTFRANHAAVYVCHSFRVNPWRAAFWISSLYRNFDHFSEFLIILQNLWPFYRTFDHFTESLIIFQNFWSFYRTFDHCTEPLIILQNFWSFYKTFDHCTELLIILQNFSLSDDVM